MQHSIIDSFKKEQTLTRKTLEKVKNQWEKIAPELELSIREKNRSIAQQAVEEFQDKITEKQGQAQKMVVHHTKLTTQVDVEPIDPEMKVKYQKYFGKLYPTFEAEYYQGGNAELYQKYKELRKQSKQ